jgi:signal transduction histidine kinase
MPQAMVGRTGSVWVVAACVAALAGVYMSDLALPTEFTLSAIGVFPIVVASWLLSLPMTLLVVMAGVALQASLGILGGDNWINSITAISTFSLIAIIGRVAAVSTARLLASHERQRLLVMDTLRSRSRVAVLEDRQRIAQDLHDGAIQALFGVGVALQALAKASADEGQQGRLRTAAQQLDGVMQDLRNYVIGLGPSILADQTLDAALLYLVRGYEAQTGKTAHIFVDRAVALQLAAWAGDLVQIASEAISNVARHAEAAVLEVTLRKRGSAAVLEIRDDGRGFDPMEAAAHGLGLGNFRARAGALGGKVDVESRPGGGTTVTVRVPVG